jgi:hypothetical protein
MLMDDCELLASQIVPEPPHPGWIASATPPSDNTNLRPSSLELSDEGPILAEKPGLYAVFFGIETAS